jgi:hypothetical protein
MIGTIDEPHRLLKDIPEYQEFEGYAVGKSGTVYSLKQFRVRKLKPAYHKKRYGKNPRLKLWNKHKQVKTVYVTRLVASAFLMHDDSNYRLRLKDYNKLHDLSVNNLHYVKPGIKPELYVPKEIELSDDMIENIKKLYGASITKGIPNIPSDVNLFLEKIMKDSIDEYISRYGLRRLLA